MVQFSKHLKFNTYLSNEIGFEELERVHETTSYFFYDCLQRPTRIPALTKNTN